MPHRPFPVHDASPGSQHRSAQAQFKDNPAFKIQKFILAQGIGNALQHHPVMGFDNMIRIRTGPVQALRQSLPYSAFSRSGHPDQDHSRPCGKVGEDRIRAQILTEHFGNVGIHISIRANGCIRFLSILLLQVSASQAPCSGSQVSRFRRSHAPQVNCGNRRTGGNRGTPPSAMRAERVTDKESSLPPLDTRNFFGSMLKAKTLQPENPRQSYCKGGTAKE